MKNKKIKKEKNQKVIVISLILIIVLTFIIILLNNLSLSPEVAYSSGSEKIIPPEESSSFFNKNNFNNKGLISYWKFDENNWSGVVGEVKDEYGINNGTAMNGTIPLPGLTGNAAFLDRKKNYIKIPNSDSLNPSKEMTISLWIKTDRIFTQSLDSNTRTLIHHSNGNKTKAISFTNKVAINAQRLSLFITNNSKLWQTDFQIYPLGNSGYFTDKNWHQIVYTYDGLNATLYIDGKFYKTGLFPGTMDFINGPFIIGSKNGTSEFFEGLIDELMFFNRSLNASEVKDLFFALSDRPLAQWSFQENNITGQLKVLDSVGKNNGTASSEVKIANEGIDGKSLEFNRNNSKVLINNFSIESKQLTISFWLNPKGGGTVMDHYWISNEGGIFKFTLQGNKTRLNVRNDLLFEKIDNYPFNSSAIMTYGILYNNTWNHVAITYDGSNYLAYINGMLSMYAVKNENPLNAILKSASAPLYLGSTFNSSMNSDYYGKLDEIKIYGKSLSGEEIKSLYNNELKRLVINNTLLGAPSNLTINDISSSKITISWKDNSLLEEGFKIEISLNNITWNTYANTGKNRTQYGISNLTVNTKYYLRISAFNESLGNSLNSPIVSATTLSNVLPFPPTNLTSIVRSFDKVSLNWKDNSDNEMGFILERSNSTLGPWSIISFSNIDEQYYLDENLNENSTYYYRVRAFNNIGNSTFSNITTRTPVQGYFDDWINTRGGYNGSISVKDAQIDNLGNIYVFGEFNGQINLGGTVNLVTENQSDSELFVAKFAPSGNVIWASKINIEFDFTDMSVSSTGGVALLGINSSIYSSDVPLFVKYNSTGSVSWVKNYIPPVDMEIVIRGIGIDSAGNVFGAGEIFDYNASACNRVYLLKYTSSGLPAWTPRIFGGPETIDDCMDSGAHDLKIDSSGNVILAGYYGFANITDSRTDLFIAKYSTGGSRTWLKNFIDPAWNQAEGKMIYLDTNNNIILFGQFGPEKILNKYSSAGNLIWNRNITSFIEDEIFDIGINNQSEIFVIWEGIYSQLVKYSANGELIMSSNQKRQDIYLEAESVNLLVNKNSGDITLVSDFFGEIEFGDSITISSGDYPKMYLLRFK